MGWNDHVMGPGYEHLNKEESMLSGIDLIAAERKRQQEVEGWTPEHDAQHTTGDLVLAAVSYALNKFKGGDYYQKLSDKLFPPWDGCWDKREKHDRIRSLAIAGALTAVAQYPEGASREQLTILTGYRRSSRDTYLQRLFSRDLVVNNGRGNIVATEGGMNVLGPDFEPLPTGEDLQAYWLNRLTGGERTILEALIRAYPKAVDREALSEATEYKRSSRDTYLQRLTARRLVDTVGRGEVRASEELFG